MKKFLLLNLSALLFTSAWCADDDYYKELRRSFNVNSNVVVDIELDFADLNVESWNQNQMEVLVQVNVEAASEARAQEILDKVSMILTEGASRTELNVLADNMNCRNRESFDVRVYLKVPVGASITGTCTFGDVHLANLNGPCKLSVDYGDLTATDLNNNGNDIDNEFGDVRINRFGGGHCKSAYGDVIISRLSGDSDVRSSFGDLRLELVEAGCKKLTVVTEYGDQKVVLANDVSFSFEASADYGDVKVTGVSRTTNTTSDYTSKKIKGTVGSGSGTMVLSSSFGDIRIE